VNRSFETLRRASVDDAMGHGPRWIMGSGKCHQRLFGELHLRDEDLRRQLTPIPRVDELEPDAPGTREALERIGAKYRLAVISNADGRIAELLAGCGIADCFDTITDSGVVGHEKPHPVIFETALRAMGAKPEESLYVGDVYSVDFVGATRAGMQTVLFDVCGAYREKGLQRVESLEELVGMIG
jgi:HAD superfamily hydrolase (TIGR01549 family)